MKEIIDIFLQVGKKQLDKRLKQAKKLVNANLKGEERGEEKLKKGLGERGK